MERGRGGGVAGDGVGGKEGGGRGLKRISAIPTPSLGFGLGRVRKPLSLVYCLRVSFYIKQVLRGEGKTLNGSKY